MPTGTSCAVSAQTNPRCAIDWAGERVQPMRPTSTQSGPLSDLGSGASGPGSTRTPSRGSVPVAGQVLEDPASVRRVGHSCGA